MFIFPPKKNIYPTTVNVHQTENRLNMVNMSSSVLVQENIGTFTKIIANVMKSDTTKDTVLIFNIFYM